MFFSDYAQRAQELTMEMDIEERCLQQIESGFMADDAELRLESLRADAETLIDRWMERRTRILNAMYHARQEADFYQKILRQHTPRPEWERTARPEQWNAVNPDMVEVARQWEKAKAQRDEFSREWSAISEAIEYLAEYLHPTEAETTTEDDLPFVSGATHSTQPNTLNFDEAFTKLSEDHGIALTISAQDHFKTYYSEEELCSLVDHMPGYTLFDLYADLPEAQEESFQDFFSELEQQCRQPQALTALRRDFRDVIHENWGAF